MNEQVSSNKPQCVFRAGCTMHRECYESGRCVAGANLRQQEQPTSKKCVLEIVPPKVAGGAWSVRTGRNDGTHIDLLYSEYPIEVVGHAPEPGTVQFLKDALWHAVEQPETFDRNQTRQELIKIEGGGRPVPPSPAAQVNVATLVDDLIRCCAEVYSAKPKNAETFLACRREINSRRAALLSIIGNAQPPGTLIAAPDLSEHVAWLKEHVERLNRMREHLQRSAQPSGAAQELWLAAHGLLAYGHCDPSEEDSAPYIAAWHRLDAALKAERPARTPARVLADMDRAALMVWLREAHQCIKKAIDGDSFQLAAAAYKLDEAIDQLSATSTKCGDAP